MPIGLVCCGGQIRCRLKPGGIGFRRHGVRLGLSGAQCFGGESGSVGLRFALSVWNFPRFGILGFDFKNGLNRRTDVLPVSVPVWCGMMVQAEFVQAEFIFVRRPARSGKIKF